LDQSQIDGVRSVVLWIIVIFAAASVLMYIALTILVFRGSNWARITTMAFGALVIVTAGIDYFNGGEQITLRTSLIGLSLDILVLFALSSERARTWSRLPHGRKYRRQQAALAAQASGVGSGTRSQPVG
jgi:hypothetical protein